MSKVLVCAATRTEADAARAGIKLAGLESKFETLPVGIGPEKAAESLKRRLDAGSHPSLIVSTGFAGSWSEELDIGAWIGAPVISNELGDHVPTQNVPTGATRVSLCSVSEIFSEPLQALVQPLKVQGLPVAVDMESFAIVQVAQNHAIDASVLRYITDSPAHPLPAFVRHFTDAVVRKDVLQRTLSIYAGGRSLMGHPASLGKFLKASLGWRSELIKGWERFSKTLV